MARVETSTRRTLPALLILYGLASLVHFAHNAEFLADYPNLPDWLSRARIYLAWCCITAVGVIGYILIRRRHQLVGLVVLAVYAALGFDGLLHYTRASFAAHTMQMNLTIWLEVSAAALLFTAVVSLAAKHVWHRGRATEHRL